MTTSLTFPETNRTCTLRTKRFRQWFPRGCLFSVALGSPSLLVQGSQAIENFLEPLGIAQEQMGDYPGPKHGSINNCFPSRKGPRSYAGIGVSQR
jgi:hypothetical protein